MRDAFAGAARTPVRAALVVAAALALAGAGAPVADAAGAPAPAGARAPASAPARTLAPHEATPPPLASARAAAALEPQIEHVRPGMNLARVLFAAKANARPGSGAVLARLGPLAPLGGGAAQFRITQQQVVGGRLYVRVLLPQRPNGSEGWLAADDVALSRTDYAVVIDTRARRIAVRFRSHEVLRIRAVVGRPQSPTPPGQFAITELVQQFPPNRFLGAWVLPLTAYSGTYREFQGGPGLVAIHGRGAASLLDPLGSAASHGCVRVSNADVTWMANHLQPGVPVKVL